jgi:hypothetical protein
MKITELLTESEIQHLEEGPKLDAFGRAVGGAVGGVAKGVGAVAGGVKGAWDAAKQGFQAGRAAVSGKPAAPGVAPAAGVQPAQAQAAADPAAGVPAAPAQPSASPTAPAQAAVTPEPATTAADANAQGPKGTAPAKPQTGDAAAAMKKGAAATAGAGTEKAGQTLYAQVKAQVGQLDKKGKQRILQLLQKSIQQAPAKGAAPAAGASAAPAGNFGFDGDTGKPFASQEERTAWFKANNKVDPKAPKDAAAPAADATQQAPGQELAAKPKRTRNKKTAQAPAPQQSQAEIDAERERIMGPTSDSIIRTGNNLAETLMKAIAAEKRRMVAEGKISIFRTH